MSGVGIVADQWGSIVKPRDKRKLPEDIKKERNNFRVTREVRLGALGACLGVLSERRGKLGKTGKLVGGVQHQKR